MSRAHSSRGTVTILLCPDKRPLRFSGCSSEGRPAQPTPPAAPPRTSCRAGSSQTHKKAFPRIPRPRVAAEPRAHTPAEGAEFRAELQPQRLPSPPAKHKERFQHLNDFRETWLPSSSLKIHCFSGLRKSCYYFITKLFLSLLINRT